MRVTKDPSGKFIIEEEPFIVEGAAAVELRAAVESANSEPSEAHRRDLENCAQLYAEAWAKRVS